MIRLPTIKKVSRAYLVAIALSIPAHAIFFTVVLEHLHPQYLDRSVGVEANSTNIISSDAADYYGRHARLLLERKGFVSDAGPITSHMPGTAVLLATSKSLFGHLGAYGFVQAGFLFLGVFLFCRKAVRIYDPVAVAWAAFLFLIHPSVLFLAWTVNSDAIFISLLLISVAVLMQASASSGRLGSAGSIMGLACYFREVALVNTMGATVALLGRRPLKNVKALLVVAGFLLLLGPWITRNALTTHSLILTTSKAPRIFFLCSFGISTKDVNPFDIDEGGSVSLDAVTSKADVFLAEHGYGPQHRPSDAFYLRSGVLNYLSHPLIQIRSLAIKFVNLMRPPAARRHLKTLLPRMAATLAFGALFVEHAALVWVGLFLLFKLDYPGLHPLRGMLLGSVAISLALWAEPRYMMPFYLPLFTLSLNFILPRLRWRGFRPANGFEQVPVPPRTPGS